MGTDVNNENYNDNDINSRVIACFQFGIFVASYPEIKTKSHKTAVLANVLYD
jgi:hypothetical protein